MGFDLDNISDQELRDRIRGQMAADARAKSVAPPAEYTLTPEDYKSHRALQADICHMLGHRGHWCEGQPSGKKTTASVGMPDVIACVHGHLLAVEIKVGRDFLKPEQEQTAKAIRASGGTCWEIRSIEQFRMSLNSLEALKGPNAKS